MGQRSPAPLAMAILCAAIHSAILQPSQALAASATGVPRDQATRFFDIPAQPLASALSALARQANLHLSLKAGLVDGIQAQALRGNFSQEQALQRLIGTASVQWNIDGQRNLILSRRDGVAGINELDDSEMLGPVTIRGGEASRLTGAAAQVYTKAGSSVFISGETLNRFRGTSPADILKGVPGVQTGDARNGGALDVNIRGIQGQSRVPVSIDGSQQAIDAYRGYSGMQQRSYIDPDLISEISVDKGPSLGADAAGAIGGMVKMKTLQPSDILKNGETYGVRLKGDLSSNTVDAPNISNARPRHGSKGLGSSPARSGSLAFASTSETLDLVAAYAQRQSGNYYAGKKNFDKYRAYEQVRKDHPRTNTFTYVTQEANSAAKFFNPDSEVFNTSTDTESVLLKAIIKPATDQSLELAYRYTDGRYGEVMPSQIIRDSTDSVPQWDPATMRINAYTARYAYKPEDNPLIDLSANVWATKAQSESFNGLARVTPLYGRKRNVDPLSDTYYKDTMRNRTKNKRWGVDLSNTSRFDTRAGRFAWTYGGSYQAEVLGPDDDSPVLLSDLQMNRFIRSGEREESSLVTSLEWSPIKPLTFTAGGRYSEFNSKDLNREASPETFGPDFNPTSYSFAPAIERQDQAFAPSFGVKLNVTDNSFVYLNYNEGVRMPSLFESTLGLFTAAVPPDDLKPERSKNWEVGASTVQHSVLIDGDTAAAKLAYFNNEIEDYITRDYTNVFFGKLQNVDSFTVKGIELQTSYDMGRVFTDISATYYLNARTCAPDIAKTMRTFLNTSSPNCVDGGFPGSYTNTQNPPKYSLNTTLGSRWFDNRLILGGRMVYNSAPTAELNNPWNEGVTTNQKYYRKSAIYDLFASFEIVQGTQLDVSIQNLTNAYYLDPLSQSYMPAPGRTLRTGLTVKF